MSFEREGLLRDLRDSKIPAAFKELDDTNKSIKPIAEYCREAYSQHDPDQVFKTTIKYTTDVLTNIAYHTHNVAQQLSAFVDAQAAQVDDLSLDLQAIALRLNAMKEATGAQGLRRSEAVQHYQRSEKLTKLADADIPAHLRPVGAWKRVGAVDYSNPDSINDAVRGQPKPE